MMHGANLSSVKSSQTQQISINPKLTCSLLSANPRVDFTIVKMNVSYVNKEIRKIFIFTGGIYAIFWRLGIWITRG